MNCALSQSQCSFCIVLMAQAMTKDCKKKALSYTITPWIESFSTSLVQEIFLCHPLLMGVLLYFFSDTWIHILFWLHDIFFSPSYHRWRWPFNRLQSKPSCVCIHSTFTCQSLPLSSLLLPFLRCQLLHMVDKAVARSWIVFLVTTKIHQSCHYYLKDEVKTGK